MSSPGIYHLDCGASYWIAATSHADARAKWVAMMIEESGYHCEGYAESDVLNDFDEPEVTHLTLTAAADVTIISAEKTEPCALCSGSGVVDARDTLLDVWREDQKLPEGNRARHGVLGCSEWP